MKLMLLFIFFRTFLFAQDSFQEFLKKEQQEFEAYVSAEDKAFSEFLKKEWKLVELKESPKPYKKKKIPNLPILPVEKKTEVPKDVKKVLPKWIKKGVIEPKKLLAQPKESELNVSFEFYGRRLRLSGIKGLENVQLKTISNKAVADYWFELSKLKLDPLFKEINRLKRELKLNDFGLALLIKSYSKSVWSANQLNQRLFLWYTLNKLHYQTKLGYTQSEVHVLVSSKQKLYGVSFFTFENQSERYYALNFDSLDRPLGKMFTYKGDFSTSAESMSFKFSMYPEIGKRMQDRSLSFKYYGKAYTVQTKHNTEMVAFLKYYPQTTMDVYTNAQPSPEMYNELLGALETHMNGMNEIDAANFLLRFVQTSFDYKTDQEQFNREKFMFLEEVLAYPYSDCEDRSIFYSFLVKELLGLDVVALNYPGHMATAVQFSGNTTGVKVSYKGKNYVVCDPTYINANIGMVMPQFKHIKPVVIGLN